MMAFSLSGVADAQRSPSETSPIRDVVQSTLIAPGSAPFHLKATITQGREGSPFAEVEMYWMAPDIFRRTIESDGFKQTLIVNGTKVFEQDSSDYFPRELRTLVTAMVDPKPILDAVLPGDRVLTQANGGSRGTELACLASNAGLCPKGTDGLREVVGASGRQVAFSAYQPFEGRPVARILTNAPRLGEEVVTLEITKLEKLRSPNRGLFEFAEETPPEKRLRFVRAQEQELRNALIGSPEIVWPQPLDGGQKGPASFFICIDRDGQIRDEQPLYTVNERTNDSAVSQIGKWKFRPFMQDGMPAQAEGVLSFSVDTRAFGPAEPLTDADARKLASGIVEPEIRPGTYPSGTTYSLWAAIDSEGKLIEVMAGDGPHELFMPCYTALRKWQFRPILENGSLLPYRAQFVFRIP
jgi:hypothetical protein